MRVAWIIAPFVALCGLAPAATAQDLTSTHARAAALAGAVTAGAEPTAAVAHNPAGLGELQSTTVAVSTQAATSRLWSAQPDRDKQRFSQDVLGLGLTLAVRPRGPEFFERLRFGVDLYSPPTHFIRLHAPAREDEPSWPLYGQRLDHLKATVVAALVVSEHLSIGAGVGLRPVLTANTAVSYEPRRGETTAQNVVVHADRSLALGAAALVGLRLRVGPALAFGASYQERQGGKIVGETSVAAGSVLIEDELDFYQTWSPAQLAVGAQVGRIGPLTASVDLVWARWSAYRTIRNEVPDPGLVDVVNARLGVEWALNDVVSVRAGYGYEPTPVRAQVSDSNLLDGRRHVAALGTGVDLGPLGLAPVRIDLHVRAHMLETQHWTKQADRLADADPQTPGMQVDNLGFPGLTAGGQFWQTGLAVVFGGRADE